MSTAVGSDHVRVNRLCLPGAVADRLVRPLFGLHRVNDVVEEITLDWARRWPIEEVWFARRL